MRARGSLFTAALALVGAAFLVQTLTLFPGSRLAPLWVIVPTLALLILQLVLEGKSSGNKTFDVLRGGGLLRTSERVELRLRLHVRDDRTHDSRRRGLRMALWGALLLGLVYALGFLAAVPLYLAPYLRSEAHVSWTRALLITGVTTGIFYLVFGLLLNVSFPPALVG